jgi:hypothetical protein
MKDILNRMWKETPYELKKADYCFLVGTNYNERPKKFKNKPVILCYLIPADSIYYCPNIIYSEKLYI